MPGIYSNEVNWYNSKNKFHQIQNPNDRSIYENNGTSYTSKNYKTIRSQLGHDATLGTIYGNGRNMAGNSNSQSRTNTRSRSHADLLTIDGNLSRPSSRMMPQLTHADPELKDAEKAGTDYHITLNLPANLLGEINNGNYESSNVEERSNFEELVLNGPHGPHGSQTESLDENVFATMRLNGPPQKSVVNIETKEPLRIITRQINQQVVTAVPPVPLVPPVPPVPKPAIINKVIKTATVNVRNEKKTARFPVNIDSKVDVRGGFVVKSIVASPARPEVGFDLQLTGGESKKIVENRTIQRPLPAPVSPPKRIEERKIRRIIHEQPVIIERQRRVRHEVQEPPKREKKIRVKKIKKISKEQIREPVQEPVRVPMREPEREPMVRRALQPLPDVVEKKVITKEETAVEIPIFEIQKALPIKRSENKEEEYVKEIKINTTVEQRVQPQQSVYDEVDESHISSQFFIERLMRGAPPDSLFQKVNVEREEEVIVGPLSQYEVEQMYAQSMINVDTVSEKVDLTLSNGVAHLILKVRNEKIVPIRGSNDHFKKSAVVVTRLIDVDLNVTPDRKEIQQQIMENQKRGRLNNRYTFELYKAFVALADADSGYSGQVPQQMVIEKTVEDHNLWDLRRQGKLSTSEDQTDLGLINEDDSDRNLRDLLVSNRVFNQNKDWDRSDSWVRTPMFQKQNQNGNAGQVNYSSSQWSANKYGSLPASNFLNNRQIFDEKGASQLVNNGQWSAQYQTKWQSAGGAGGGGSGGGRAGGEGAGGISGVAMSRSTPWMANINVPTATNFHGGRSFQNNRYMDMNLVGSKSMAGGGSSAFASNQWSGGNYINSYPTTQLDLQGDRHSRHALSELNMLRQLEPSSNLEDYYNSGVKTSQEFKSSSNLVLEEDPLVEDLIVRRFKVRNPNNFESSRAGYQEFSKVADQESSRMHERFKTDTSQAPIHKSTTTEVSKTNYSNAYVPRNPM